MRSFQPTSSAPAPPDYDARLSWCHTPICVGPSNGQRYYHMLLYTPKLSLYVCWPPIQGLKIPSSFFLIAFLLFILMLMFVGLHWLCTVSRNAQASFIHLLTLSLLCLVVICFLGSFHKPCEFKHVKAHNLRSDSKWSFREHTFYSYQRGCTGKCCYCFLQTKADENVDQPHNRLWLVVFLILQQGQLPLYLLRRRCL